MSTVMYISGIGGSGDNATAVSFGKTEEGVRLWAWVPNAKAEELAPGMKVTVEVTSAGPVETSYTDKETQKEIALKVPRQQLWLGGDILADAPEQDPLPEAKWQVTDAAKAYREAYLAKRQAKQAPKGAGETEDFG